MHFLFQESSRNVSLLNTALESLETNLECLQELQSTIKEIRQEREIFFSF